MRRPARTRVSVRIERLTLAGIALEGAEAKHMRAALEAELSRMLMTSDLAGVFASAGAAPSVAARDIQMPTARRGARATALGGVVAHSLFEAMGGTKGPGT